MTYSCSWYFLTILCISLGSVVIFSFISDFIYLDPFSFFLDWVWLKVCQSCLDFQRTSSWIHWSYVLFSLDSISFISALIFISFFLLTLGFVLLQIPLSVKLDSLFEFYLVFWDRSVMLWISLRIVFPASHRLWIVVSPFICFKISFDFFLDLSGMFSRIDHMIGHETSLNKYEKIETISSIFSDHNAMKPEINHKKNTQRHESKITCY